MKTDSQQSEAFNTTIAVINKRREMIVKKKKIDQHCVMEKVNDQIRKSMHVPESPKVSLKQTKERSPRATQNKDLSFIFKK